MVLFSLTSCSEDTEEIVIAAAANVQYPVQEIIDSFKNRYNISIRTVYGSSGKLTAQVLAGANFDVFISADTLYPKKISAEHKSVYPPRVYAYGHLILWSTKYKKDELWKVLGNGEFDHLPIANPKIAPYGVAAMDVINHLVAYDKISDKLVLGESVSQVNQFIHTGAADLGITASSISYLSAFKNVGDWISIPDSLYQSIVQSAILISQPETKHDWSEKFYQYLFGEEAREILRNFGYSLPEL